jgi:hypothetical protein
MKEDENVELSCMFLAFSAQFAVRYFRQQNLIMYKFLKRRLSSGVYRKGCDIEYFTNRR